MALNDGDERSRPLGDEPLRKHCAQRNPYEENRRLRERIRKLENFRKRTECENVQERTDSPTFMRNGVLISNQASLEVPALLKVKKESGASYLWLNEHGEIETLLPSKLAFDQVPHLRQVTAFGSTYKMEDDLMASLRFEASQMVRNITTIAKIRSSLPLSSSDHTFMEYLCEKLSLPFPRILEMPIDELYYPSSDHFRSYQSFRALWIGIYSLFKETRRWIKVFVKKLLQAPKTEFLQPGLVQLNINGVSPDWFLENGCLNKFLEETPNSLEGKGKLNYDQFKSLASGSRPSQERMEGIEEIARIMLAESSKDVLPQSPPFSPPAARSPSYHVRSPTPNGGYGGYAEEEHQEVNGESSSSGVQKGET